LIAGQGVRVTAERVQHERQPLLLSDRCHVLAVRRSDIPGNGSLAAILRYAP
jgi:hypothetical protein